MAFLLAEDEAIHRALRSIQVDDRVAQGRGQRRTVDVRYRLPENEARDADYPFITIDLIDITRATQREHRGRIVYDYVPDEPGYEQFIDADGEKKWFRADYPVPYDLTYQVTTYSRFAWQDRQIQRALMVGPFSRMRSSILVGGPPASDSPDSGQYSPQQTYRVLTVLTAIRGDARDANNKRVFRQSYGIRVESELPPATAQAASAAITNVVINVQATG